MCSALWILGMTCSTWIGAGHSFFPVGCGARIQANQIFSFRRTRTMAIPEHSRTKLLLIQAVRTACMSCSNYHKYLSSPWRSSEDSTVVRFVWSMDMTQGRLNTSDASSFVQLVHQCTSARLLCQWKNYRPFTELVWAARPCIHPCYLYIEKTACYSGLHTQTHLYHSCIHPQWMRRSPTASSSPFLHISNKTTYAWASCALHRVTGY